eukprot:1019396-Rhodomonas_salina.2
MGLTWAGRVRLGGSEAYIGGAAQPHARCSLQGASRAVRAYPMLRVTCRRSIAYASCHVPYEHSLYF